MIVEYNRDVVQSVSDILKEFEGNKVLIKLKDLHCIEGQLIAVSTDSETLHDLCTMAVDIMDDPFYLGGNYAKPVVC